MEKGELMTCNNKPGLKERIVPGMLHVCKSCFSKDFYVPYGMTERELMDVIGIGDF